MIEATDLRKRYGPVAAVEGVSLRAARGRILGLLGPNGAGKTTTIRILLRILAPDAGSVSYDGAPFDPSVLDRIGYLPEERGLYRKSRVLPTIAYFAGLRGMAASEARLRATEWLRRFELADKADHPVEALSKGNQQKVQFIIAVIHDPEYVVLDEPFSDLDPLNQGALDEVLRELRDRGKAVILSTHGMHQAEELCDDICLIDGGRVVLGGTLEGVRSGFGRETARIEFAGDPEALRSIPDADVAELGPGRAELLLADPSRLPGVVAELARRVDLRLFERRGPSLRTIFLETVRKGRGGGRAA